MYGNKIKKIIFFTNTLSAGGAERFYPIQLSADKGLDICLMTTVPEEADFYNTHKHIRRVSLDKKRTTPHRFPNLKGYSKESRP